MPITGKKKKIKLKLKKKGYPNWRKQNSHIRDIDGD